MSQVVPPQGRTAVLCLQRLGDLLTATHVVHELGKIDNISEIELIHFDKTSDAAKLLPGVHCRHDLDFNRLKQVGRIHTLAPFAYLQQRIAEICGQTGFDSIVNLSSTPFACALSRALARRTSRHYGPTINESGEFIAGDPYCRFLNDWGTSTSLNMFAHQDIYAAAAGIDPGHFRGNVETLSGSLHANHLISPASLQPAPLAFHLVSSDPRKDWSSQWSVQGWRGLIHALRCRYHGEFWLFGAPHQRAYLNEITSFYDQSVRVFTCDLQATASLLRQCAGLVSVDTVAIHLGYLVGCKTVVLQLGPAGGLAFMPGSESITVQSRRSCSPCSGDRCEASTLHACHRDFHVSDIAAICEAHFFSTPVPPYIQSTLSKRVLIRQCNFDAHGLRARSSPDWLPSSPQESSSDIQDNNWRTAWWKSWQDPNTCDKSILEPLFECTDEIGTQRLHRGLEDTGDLGQMLRNYAQKHKFRMTG